MLLFALLACSPTPLTTPDGEATAAPEANDDDTVGEESSEDLDDFEDQETDLRNTPVLFVHGITGEASNFDVAIDYLIDEGWDENLLFADTFEDPEWGCNVDNADSIDRWVDAILETTGSEKVHLVAHSMGTLSSRYYLKNLADSDKIASYVTLGGMHHGLRSSCSPDFPFKPCIWEEICSRGEFVEELNLAPTTPNAHHYVSIYGTGDETVPNWSSQLDGAFWVELDDLEHFGPDGVLEHPDALDELQRALLWPAD